MPWYQMTRPFAVALFPALLAVPTFAEAQEAKILTDLRTRGNYSAQDLAQALFTEPSGGGVRTRGVGPAQALPVAPVPRPAVTLNVLFPPSSPVLQPVSQGEVDKLGTVLSWPQYSEYRIQLEGHTDSQGSERKNQSLSEKRVQGIKDYLMQRFQVADNRVNAVGYGASKPIASNETPEGRSQNRRVEVVNIGR